MQSNQEIVHSQGDGTSILSIIIPTYNESENIINLLDAIKINLPDSVFSEIIVVDDNSPDGTSSLVSEYIKNEDNYHKNDDNGNSNSSSNVTRTNCKFLILNRKEKNGLIPAILEGIKNSTGKYILIMDADFSHPPEAIPKMVDALLKNSNSIVVGSRYVKNGSIVGWPFKRRLLSRGAAKIARLGLRVKNVSDPMSGFFAFPRSILDNVRIDTKGYKILLEILVKIRGVSVVEIPYTFTDRQSGKSKMNSGVILDYIGSVWQLYRYGQKKSPIDSEKKKNKSILFLSKAGRFYTIAFLGVAINYIVSFILADNVANSIKSLSNTDYIQVTGVGILTSIVITFLLHKIWTFEDTDFSSKKIARQSVLFFGISAIGALLQLGILYLLVSNSLDYKVSLIIAILSSCMATFILNKKYTFKENVFN